MISAFFVDVALDNLFRHPLIEICREGSANFAACKIKVNEIDCIATKFQQMGNEMIGC
jgi:hypothetical protein